MAWDFNQIIERRGTGCLKWNYLPYDGLEGKDLLPMWVADMDIPTPSFITDRIRKRLDHPMFGYFNLEANYFDAIIGWHNKRFGVTGLQAEHIAYQNSVLGAVVTAVTSFTNPGDHVLVQAPGYHKFKVMIENNGRVTASNPLKWNGTRAEFDFEDMERQIREKKIKLAFLCSPHNPAGRVWEADELTRYVALCKQYNVVLVSDEIHADLVLRGKHLPTQMLSQDAKDITIGLYAPTKTFNLAGLVSAYSVIYNEELRQRFVRTGEITHYNCPNILSIEATNAAYEEGGPWVDALCEHLRGNAQYLVNALQTRLPKVKTFVPEATYLMWVDFRDTGLSQQEIVDRVVYKGGLICNNGPIFIQNGEGFMRINIACPRAYMEDAVERLCRAFA